MDVPTAQEYDNYGRVIKNYVPYQSAYDNGSYWAVVPGTPFTLTQYENSPLSRVTSVTPPGGYATITSYGSNTSIITIPGTSLSYPVGSLYETRVTDPDNRVNITYTDKRGRLILSRQTNTSGTSPADTYYQYDDKDRLVRVIPPGATAANADLIYTYEYDAGDRLTKKKVPGAGHQYMKYNTRDLLVFSRDSNLVTAGQCLGYKYDDYGRVLETGLVTGFPIDPNAAFSFAELQTKNFYDGYDGNIQLPLAFFPQYRGRVRSSENRVLGSTTWLHTTFTYDAYGRIIQTLGNNYLNNTYAFAEIVSNTYDYSDFLLASTRIHQPGAAAGTGYQTIISTYLNDHAGRKTDLLLEVGGVNTHLAKYSYDFRERLIERNLHSGLYGSTWAWLQSVDYAYNDQNWLTAINTKNATGTSQALNATCSPTLPNPGSTPLVTYPEDNDLFYLELRYEQLFSSSSTTGGAISGLYEFPQKAGNIAQMVWRVRGRERQAYSFNYDHLSRLSFSLYYDVNTSNVASSSYRFMEYSSYDNRGNIMSMYRNGYYQDGATCTFGQIDNLTYSYTSNTNRLASVSDATATANAKIRGFNPGLGGSGYTYDGNGNLKSDSYKGITNITYNHLNLPRLITFSSGNSIELIYDASGNKVRKIVKQGGTVLYEQDYAGGLEYRKTPASGTFRIEAIYHEEGRYFNLNVETNNTVSWRKEYALRDHLGNTRIMFADKNANGIVEITGNASTNEILQENHYYPFGLGFEGPAWMNDAARDNKYQYNGKEWNDDFGLNWNDYGARWYDAAANRWWVVDPLAEKYTKWSPYNYVLNNPIRLIDPDGMDVIESADRTTYTGEDAVNLFKQLKNGSKSRSEAKPAEIQKNIEGKADDLDCNCDCPGKPPCENQGASIAESIVPFYGSYLDMIYRWEKGEYIRSIGNAALFVTDIALVKALFVGIVKGTIKAAAKGVTAEGAVWAQKTFSGTFSAGGKFAGQTVEGVAGALRSGGLSAADVPIDVIVRNGQTFILNTRSSAALMQAGIPRSAWNVVNRTGVSAFEGRLTNQLLKNSIPGGTNTIKSGSTILNH